jgi:hypothetical protein
MRAYLATTGTVFGLVVLAHALRVMDEGTHLLTDPWWILMTVAAAALSAWAWRLFRGAPRA